MSSHVAMAEVDPLPLVPVMWMEGMDSWGSPSRAVSARMRSRLGTARRRGMLRSKSMWSSSQATAAAMSAKGGPTPTDAPSWVVTGCSTSSTMGGRPVRSGGGAAGA